MGCHYANQPAGSWWNVELPITQQFCSWAHAKIEDKSSNKPLYTRFTATSHTHKRWKQPKCPSVDKQINKMWSVHTVDYYPAII